VNEPNSTHVRSGPSDAVRFSVLGVLATILFAISSWTLVAVIQLKQDVVRVETDEHWIKAALKKSVGEVEDDK
jgi:hypothetical protein